jgi:Tol biopolymer transport system component
MTVNPDGSNLAYLGNIRHHPNWHPIEDRIIANVNDCNGTLRFGFYHGDGKGLLEYVPKTTGAGHPTVSPDGRWICTDGKYLGDKNGIILCDPISGNEIFAATFMAVSEGYASFEALSKRKEGESVISAINGIKNTGMSPAKKRRQTQAHSVWSRDGSAILFNIDLGDQKGSQLYMINVEEALANS